MEGEEEDKDLKKLSFTTAVIFTLMIFWLLFGAMVFSLLERDNEVEENMIISAGKQNYTSLLEELIDLLVNDSNRLTKEEAIELINNVTNATLENSMDETTDWDYGGSLFFIMTVFTTIGYGNTAPETTGGQVAFIFFAVTGIPLSLVFFKFSGILLRRVTQRFITKSKHSRELGEIAVFFIAGLVLLILIPAAIFHAIQGWDYFSSVYYCSVTLTTVGFGDFVPGITSNDSVNDFYRVCVACWIFIGLTYFFVVSEHIQKEIETAVRNVGRKNNG